MLLEFTFPYQDSLNKAKLDFVSNCCNQLNNVNFAQSNKNDEAKEKNQTYLVISESGKINFMVFLSISLNENREKYKCISSSITHIDDSKFNDIPKLIDHLMILNKHEIFFKFDLKKFFSVLSFSSNYKDRRTLTFYYNTENKNIEYHISEKISVVLATRVDNPELYNRLESEFFSIVYKNTIKDLQQILYIENVDKNSFLIPYANHKDCLNFALSASNGISDTYLYGNENLDENFIATISKNDNQMFYETIMLLRKDKFNFKEIQEDTKVLKSAYKVSPAFWQILAILQNDKQWKYLSLYNDNYILIDYNKRTTNNTIVGQYAQPIIIKTDFYLSDEKYITNLDNIICLKLLNSSSNTNYDESNLEHVGDLTSDEIFLLNKLFSKVKDCYFDFSSQTFIGSGYLFQDEENKNDKVIINLTNPNNIKSELPLKLVFSELKHYVGTDLSQKSFIIKVETDGIFVKLSKYNKIDNDVLKYEYSIIFDHLMSKKYLDL